jgi:hypothetical protein
MRDDPEELLKKLYEAVYEYDRLTISYSKVSFEIIEKESEAFKRFKELKESWLEPDTSTEEKRKALMIVPLCRAADQMIATFSDLCRAIINKKRVPKTWIDPAPGNRDKLVTVE